MTETRVLPPAGEAGFEACAPLVLSTEGGFVDHARDPGGATNRGVTFATFKAWRAHKGMPEPSLNDLRDINEEEAKAIYRAGYWRRCYCEELPLPLAFLTFDAAINHGPGKAGRFLQHGAKAGHADPGPIDGAIGPRTIAAAQACDPVEAILEFCAQRAAFYGRLSTFDAFGLGWSRRNAHNQQQAFAFLRQARAPRGFERRLERERS